jgi:hypothetical protein
MAQRHYDVLPELSISCLRSLDQRFDGTPILYDPESESCCGALPSLKPCPHSLNKQRDRKTGAQLAKSKYCLDSNSLVQITDCDHQRFYRSSVISLRQYLCRAGTRLGSESPLSIFIIPAVFSFSSEEVDCAKVPAVAVSMKTKPTSSSTYNFVAKCGFPSVLCSHLNRFDVLIMFLRWKFPVGQWMRNMTTNIP